MTPDFEAGRCPQKLAQCRGLVLLRGEDAKRFLGIFALLGSTALVCPNRLIDNFVSQGLARACEGTMEGGATVLEDIPVE